MNIKPQLIELGLDEKETEIYLLLLKLGTSSISQILKLTEIKKGDLYNVLYRLSDKSLIEKNKNSFCPLNPDSLLNLLQREKKEIINRENLISDILPQLLEIYEKGSSEFTHYIYNEKNDIKKNYDLILQSNRKKFLFFSSLENFNEYFYKNILKINGSKCQILFSFEIQKNDLEKYLKFSKQIKFLEKNIDCRFIFNSFNFDEDFVVLGKELFLLKSNKNKFMLRMVNDVCGIFALKFLNFVFNNAFNINEFEEILLTSKNIIVLKNENIFSQKFLRKNKKFFTGILLEKINLLK